MLPNVPKLSFAYLCITSACGLEEEGSLMPRPGGRAGFTHMGQSSYSMGLEWTRFHIRVTIITAPKKGLMLFYKQTHTDLIYHALCIPMYIFSSAG